jgi:hypothetical protein
VTLERDGVETGADGPDRLLLAQAAYFVATGVWPLISPGSFQAVTGPKDEMWLVKTFGLLVTAVGAGIGTAAMSRRVPPSIRVTAVGSAAVLAAADGWYVARGRIPKTYLIDAVAEAGFVAALLLRRR